ncbi:signal transduction histidine kinase [Microbacterium sp. BK668]|nr:signal transduction histidine kinase [Microbacterium sp. BK668]
MAIICGTNVAVYLVPTTAWDIPAALAAAGLILVMPQRPVIAGALVLVLQLTLTFTDLINSSNAGFLATYFVGVYFLGRYAEPWRGGLIALTFAAVFTWGVWNFGTIAFSLVLTGCTFGYGRVVQLRAQRAERARMSTAELEATDAALLAARIVADERARLGGQSLELLRAAVEGMRADAAAARADLDATLIESVCQRGRQGVAELRWLLGILRSEPAPDPPKRLTARWRPIVDVIVGSVLLVICVLEVWFQVWEPASPLSWVLAVMLPACTLIRRRFTLLACTVAAVGVWAGLLSGVLPSIGELLCATFLAWSAGTAARAVVWLAFGALAVGVAAWGSLHDPGNAIFTFALLALPAFAGFEWSAEDRAARAATARADRLRADLKARVESARREERLRLARELHDVTSHAVGVMVLQASAASALRDRDPAAASEALKTVDKTAAQTLQELDLMFELLDSGAIGAPGLATPTHEPLQTLVDRIRKTGLAISLAQASIPRHLDDVVYRIVQESLTNIVRHSNAQHVRISVAVSEGKVTVRVVDNGTQTPGGRNPSSDSPGFGLAGLGERVDRVGGTFRAGWQEQGFTVEAVLTIEPAVTS